MREITHLFSSEEHTRERWLEHYEAICRGTALEAHEIRLIDIDDQQIVMEMEITNRDRQPYGLIHGGMHLLLGESAASLHACWGVDLTRRVPVGIEISGSHLRAAADGRLQVHGEVIRRSRSLIHHQYKVIHLDTAKVLSVGRVTNLYKEVDESL